MSVVLIFNQKPSEEWQLKLSELLPDTKVEVYPNVENVDKVDFVATWKPHVGYVNEFPNSANVYDSRGEAYFNKKEYALSKSDYIKILELEPTNQNAKELLLKIEDALKK